MYYVLSPPYERIEHVPAGRIDRAPLGAILALRPGHDATTEVLIGAVTETQQTFPYLTLCLWLDLFPKKLAAGAIGAAAQRGVRGVIYRGLPDPSILREQITTSAHLVTDIMFRLSLVGFGTNPHVHDLIAIACDKIGQHQTIQHVAHELNVSIANLHRIIAAVGLGTPAKLFLLSRSVRVALELQRDTQTPMALMAGRFGFADDAALRSRFREVFGVPPSTVRRWIGWERLLFIGLRRNGLQARR